MEPIGRHEYAMQIVFGRVVRPTMHFEALPSHQVSAEMDQYRDQFNAPQSKVIARLFKAGPDGFKGGLSAENYISIKGTSRATATRDLQDLVEKGALNRTGELRYTRYWLKLDRDGQGVDPSYLFLSTKIGSLRRPGCLHLGANGGRQTFAANARTE
ncbi:hypothetical protein RUM4293_03576 [Ruegeria atlantica]|uniref:HTH deoR-type domain-containing protein n=2 Tax=Ruegeria atlantica TaxID=81569 RepID=A0A0P1E8M3_9RHOB|nr:hypothetical protein RUM4293_03576 [Ruegeria atlantica]